MINFGNFLKKPKGEDVTPLLKECKPYLTVIRNDVVKYRLYRGVSGRAPSFFKRKVRINRVPKDTDPRTHEILNDLFNRKFKIKARSQCLFVVGSKSVASGYGLPRIIFPVGKFKFIWSPKIRDLYGKILGTFDPGLEDEEYFYKLSKLISTYQTTDLRKAIESGNEIMIDCKEYYGVDEKSPEMKSIIELTKKK